MSDAENRGDHPDAEPDAEHRGDAQRRQALLTDRLKTAADRVAHAVGQRQRHCRIGLLVQPAGGGEQLHELVDEERVAGARLMHSGDERRRDLARLAGIEGARADRREATDLVAVEARERQPPRRTRQATERHGELPRACASLWR